MRCTHLREFPELVDRLVVQSKAGLHTICIVSGPHALDLWALLIAKAVTMQVMDVCHVNSVLKHTPVVAVELNLTCKCTMVLKQPVSRRAWVDHLSWILSCAKKCQHITNVRKQE